MSTAAPERGHESALFLGLMSGTSMDGIDCALVQCTATGTTLAATHSEPIPDSIREDIVQLSLPGANEIERLGVLDRRIGKLFARAANTLLQREGILAGAVRAIGSHGQTIRHRPPSDDTHSGEPFTLQIGDPATITELTGVTTVADFRRRDIAAGGEGAPLAPAFHAEVFCAEGKNRAVVNIGGIANVTLLRGCDLIEGFDTGPGNTLIDQWARKHTGQAFDRGGRWAATGSIAPALLEALLAHPYFQKSGPRSTGREAFNLPWLDRQLARYAPLEPQDVQATLTEFTALGIARAIAGHSLAVDEILVCGGGAHNEQLLDRIALALPGCAVTTTETVGMDPDWVEAATFAWLASRTLAGLAGNNPAVTGAAGERILGAVFHA